MHNFASRCRLRGRYYETKLSLNGNYRFLPITCLSYSLYNVFYVVLVSTICTCFVARAIRTVKKRRTKSLFLENMPRIASEHKGIVYCLCVTLAIVPLVWKLLTNAIMSQTLPTISVHYSLFVTAWGLYLYLIPPTEDFWSFDKRCGIFYYCCCLLTSLSAVILTAHVHNAYSKNKAKLLSENEIYLKTPHGVSSEVFHSLLTFGLALFMIYRMENRYSPRNAALYWSSATLTNELLFLCTLVSQKGPYSIRYSTLVHVLYIAIAVSVLNFFMRVKRRIIPCRTCERKNIANMDMALMIGLGISLLSLFFRLLSAFYTKPRSLQAYIKKFEPMMMHPINLGKVWILMAGLLSIPCCVLGILYIRRFACRKSLNMAVIYAGGLLQGTFVYMTFWKLVNIQPRFKVANKVVPVTVLINLLPVIAAHAYLLRCLKGAPLELKGDCAILFEKNDSDEDETSSLSDDEEEIEETACEFVEEKNDDDDDDDNDDDETMDNSDRCRYNEDVCNFDDDNCEYEPSLRKRLVRFTS